MPFDESLQRVLEATELRKQKELASFLGISAQAISNKKGTEKFPPDWAYKISEYFNISLDWIYTGKGSKKLSNISHIPEEKFPILDEANEWLIELVAKEPYRHEWFRASFEDAFPLFKEWMKRKEELQSDKPVLPDSKVA